MDNTSWGFQSFNPSIDDLDKKVRRYWVEYYDHADKEFRCGLTRKEKGIYIKSPKWLKNDLFACKITKTEFFSYMKRKYKTARRNRC